MVSIYQPLTGVQFLTKMVKSDNLNTDLPTPKPGKSGDFEKAPQNLEMGTSNVEISKMAPKSPSQFGTLFHYPCQDDDEYPF